MDRCICICINLLEEVSNIIRNAALSRQVTQSGEEISTLPNVPHNDYTFMIQAVIVCLIVMIMYAGPRRQEVPIVHRPPLKQHHNDDEKKQPPPGR